MSARPILLLVHDDPDVLDWLTSLLEAGGYEVVIGATAFAARAKLERIEVVAILAGWDSGGGAGEKLAAWAAERRPDLRDRFAILGDPAAVGDAGGLPVFRANAYDDLLEFANKVSARVGAAPPVPIAEETPVAQRSPRLLLVEDDVHQLRFITEILSGYGFDVVVAESAAEAIEILGAGSIDVILSDWMMDGGGGEALYDWLLENDAPLLERTIFITGGSTREIRERAPVASAYPKGQDAKLLIAALTRAARRALGS
jgi:CheY-like chemotaxis protein